MPAARRFGAAAAIASVALALLSTAPSRAAVMYSLPGAPTGVTATSVAGGVLVQWKAPSNGNTPISAYAVTGGPGTCAVVVDAGTYSTVVPAVEGQQAAVFKVVASNSLGNSEPGVAASAVVPGAGVGVRVIGRAGGSAVVGSGAELRLGRHTVVAATSTRDGAGLWYVDKSGDVFAVGSADSIGGTLAGTVALVGSLDDRGLTMVSRKGAVRSLGTASIDATLRKGAAVVGAAGTADGKGLWVVRQDGTIVSVGTAKTLPSIKGAAVKAVTGNAARTGGWALRADGTIAAFGAAAAIPGKVTKGVGLWHSAAGRGVWVLRANGVVTGLGDAEGIPSSGIANAVAIVGATPDVRAQSVTIDEFSDFHGQIEAASGIGGAAALKVFFDADKAKGTTIVASAGDNFGAAPPISAQFEELPTILAMNQMGVDVSTLGNHEHDRNLAHLQKMIDASAFKWTVSNYSSFDSLKGITPFTIIERGGVKVAFVGANNTETSQVATSANLGTVAFTDPVVAVNAQIIAARKAGAQMVVVLVHYGFAESVAGKATGPLIDIAAQIKGADLMFGAHSHLKWAGRVGGMLVSQTVNAGGQYARNTICRDANTGRVLGTAGEIVVPAVKNVTPDAAVTALVKGYADQIATKFDTKLGTISGVFPFGGSPAIQRQGEAAIGDYIADIVRAKYGTDIVIINGGGIRASIPALGYKPKDLTLLRPATAASTGTFDVTLGDVYTVLPFGNQLTTTAVTGAQIWSAMENGVSQYEAVAGRFPQISGFKFSFDVKKPVGSRIVSVTLPDGTPIANDASKSYTLTTLDYMISGGDGYTQFNPSKAFIRDLYAQVVADYIVAHPSIVIPVLDGRITKL